MVSMFSAHFFNWSEQLKDSGHEIYWLDVYDSNTYVKKIGFINQIIGWRNKLNYPGRYYLKRKLSKVYNFINLFNQRKLADVFEETLLEIQPDVVHSFVMYSACVPILGVMKKYSHIKWIYSAWGNDLYYYQNIPSYLKGIKAVLPRIDYMFADCKRDFHITRKYSFKGEYLGTFPGGGGYDFSCYTKFLNPYSNRKVILIKGYQHKFGRCNNILEAISSLKKELSAYEIVVFGTHQSVFDFVSGSKELQNMENLKIIGQINHNEVLKLMGESFIYIGNSISDGMPNTLLEAIIMEVFPIQSNPGGATAEIIEHGKNGLLIEDPEDVEEIVKLILKSIDNLQLMQDGVSYNNQFIKPRFEREKVKCQVLKKYKLIEEELKTL
ncbi:glycosyltransferase family 4 protein [Gillisia limnaea]|uniref:Glycosyl transferase group 1 n=2 Tax=Gillisia TaxID=244698 RepID=H2BV75_GILLR|nr:glycosyl transferase group 1 [Gillisia limnaea DSM 15749]